MRHLAYLCKTVAVLVLASLSVGDGKSLAGLLRQDPPAHTRAQGDGRKQHVNEIIIQSASAQTIANNAVAAQHDEAHGGGDGIIERGAHGVRVGRQPRDLRDGSSSSSSSSNAGLPASSSINSKEKASSHPLFPPVSTVNRHNERKAYSYDNDGGTVGDDDGGGTAAVDGAVGNDAAGAGDAGYAGDGYGYTQNGADDEYDYGDDDAWKMEHHGDDDAASATGDMDMMAPEDCNEDVIGAGKLYRGCQTETKSGKTCQHWHQQHPHKHDRFDVNFPGTGLKKHNYCRNPDNETTIWCYTTDPATRWEFCAPLPGGTVSANAAETNSKGEGHDGGIVGDDDGGGAAAVDGAVGNDAADAGDAGHAGDGYGYGADDEYDYGDDDAWKLEHHGDDDAASATGDMDMMAPEDCNEDVIGAGKLYRGCQTETKSGKTCQHWHQQHPHKHDRFDVNFPGTGLKKHNYCRNPDNETTIWCYTTDPATRWEFCAPLPGGTVSANAGDAAGAAGDDGGYAYDGMGMGGGGNAGDDSGDADGVGTDAPASTAAPTTVNPKAIFNVVVVC